MAMKENGPPEHASPIIYSKRLHAPFAKQSGFVKLSQT